MFEKVAIVGNFDLVFAFRALGIRVYSPLNIEEAKQAMKNIKEEKFALCFLDERLLKTLEEEIEDLSREFCPVVVGFSDYREITGYLKDMMSKLAIKATGSDSLIRRRGDDETR